MSNLHFSIRLPTDQGFIGRVCLDPKCGRYFKILAARAPEAIHCPYCGAAAAAEDLATKPQLDYALEEGKERATEWALGEIDKMFAKLERESRRDRFVRFEHKPANYKARPVVPGYSERKVDTELTCPECSVRFQVFGVFGYCPGCRTENTMIFDANAAIIEKEIQASGQQERGLRHAYADLVSTFETFCRRKANHISKDPGRFQNLVAARKYFVDHLSLDIFDHLAAPEELVVRRVFQKRHANTHSGGVVDDQYIKHVPEEASLKGTKVVLSLDEWRQAVKLVRTVLDRLVVAIDDPRRAQ